MSWAQVSTWGLHLHVLHPLSKKPLLGCDIVTILSPEGLLMKNTSNTTTAATGKLYRFGAACCSRTSCHFVTCGIMHTCMHATTCNWLLAVLPFITTHIAEAGVGSLILLTTLWSKLQPEFISHADSFVRRSIFCLTMLAAVKACMTISTWKLRFRHILQQSWKVSRNQCWSC